MAHFAKLNDSNVVLQIDVVNNSDTLDGNGDESESVGITFLTNLTGHSNWKKTSYNTLNNSHILGGTPFRKNYAVIGGTYDSTNDAFWHPKPHASWTKNTTTWSWEAPKAEPTHSEVGDTYVGIQWNETDQRWQAQLASDITKFYAFDSTAKSWTQI
tara:strand:+ start:74 stop:544 length:471 start_codon:yes stop_codon:yes gene_type:complete